MKIRKVPASWLDAPLKPLMATDKAAGKPEASNIKGSNIKGSNIKSSKRRRSKAKSSGKPAS